jgi:hypothetical protein
VLSAIAAPYRYRLRALDDLGAECFYDGRHARIVAALRAGTELPAPDLEYLDRALATAWPLCRGHIERLRELTRRREVALDLVRQLEEVTAA